MNPDPLFVDEEPWVPANPVPEGIRWSRCLFNGGHAEPTWSLDGYVVCERCAPVTPPRHIPWRWLALALVAYIAWRKLL